MINSRWIVGGLGLLGVTWWIFNNKSTKINNNNKFGINDDIEIPEISRNPRINNFQYAQNDFPYSDTSSSKNALSYQYQGGKKRTKRKRMYKKNSKRARK
jgi:hypothetical protein